MAFENFTTVTAISIIYVNFNTDFKMNNMNEQSKLKSEVLQQCWFHKKHLGTTLHIEAETKWPPFSRRHFQMDFLEWKYMNFD